MDDAGRLGARYDSGLNCPLLVQLAQAMRPPGLDVLQIRAWKSPPHCARASLRTDVGDVKVVLWLNPDDDNLDPRSGGLFLGQRYIGYRQNRAVVFDARLPHGAADCDFRDDHASWRLQVELVYGDAGFDSRLRGNPYSGSMVAGLSRSRLPQAADGYPPTRG
jgi:hypothetical protein